MRNRASACALFLALMAVPALAQAPPAPSADTQLVAPPAWAFNDLACAPALLTDETRQEATNPPFAWSASRTLPSATCSALAIRSSSAAARMPGCSPGSAFSCGASYRHGDRDRTDAAPTIHTVGMGPDSWCRHDGVHGHWCIHACEAILFDDYLEPFVAPMIAARPLPGTTPQYDNMGHIVTGIEGHPHAQRQATS